MTTPPPSQNPSSTSGADEMATVQTINNSSSPSSSSERRSVQQHNSNAATSMSVQISLSALSSDDMTASSSPRTPHQPYEGFNLNNLPYGSGDAQYVSPLMAIFAEELMATHQIAPAASRALGVGKARLVTTHASTWPLTAEAQRRQRPDFLRPLQLPPLSLPLRLPLSLQEQNHDLLCVGSQFDQHLTAHALQATLFP